MNDLPLPVGFRFYPTEEELLSYYLPHKLNASKPDIDRVIPLLNIYDYNPSDLPQLAGEVCREDKEQWFFFTAMQEREARGGRPNRRTKKGYWKATGSPSDVYTSQNLRIGRKKTMVFYEGRAPYGSKTTWKMNEYKLYNSHHQSAQLVEELSLCRIYKRSKCARAFDRRPPVEVAAAPPHEVAAVQYHHHHHQQQQQHHRSADVAVAITSSENEQQINNINNNPAAVESDQLINWDLATQAEPFWDSELLMLLNTWFDF